MSKRIILASASPRRAQILKMHGIAAEIIPADVDEALPADTNPRIACMYNALKKALYVEEMLTEGSVADGHAKADAVIIAADTIVYNGNILGKPADDEDAFRMLSELRGCTHYVMTGTAVVAAGQKDKRVFCEITSVSFGDYSDDEIRSYIATGEPADKAGSYAIQGQWSSHITATEGDYFNVIGLPWERLRCELVSLGVDVHDASQNIPEKKNDFKKIQQL
jgi:septum formation protein